MVTYSSKELLKMLFGDGWYIKHQRGSHIQLVHPTKIGKVTIPHPKKDMPQKTIQSILKQAGIIN